MTMIRKIGITPPPMNSKMSGTLAPSLIGTDRIGTGDG